ncbi:MAG: T3SS effector HopA1 family protein [Candidatus Paceibacterota bacterium]|jgi:hypothetical protein|nr:T3SS effector HopA1 family protein [bacterium]
MDFEQLESESENEDVQKENKLNQINSDVKSGESKELSDIPTSFVIEDKKDLLLETEGIKNNNNNIIPPQYRGMPSEIVAELWTNKTYLDDEKNKTENERRGIAIEKIKTNELKQEKERSNNFKKIYSKLSENQKIEYLNSQKKVEDYVVGYIQDKNTIENLSLFESFVLNKIKDSYEKFKKNNPDKSFSFEFSRDIDRAIYDNLFYKLSFRILKSDGVESIQGDLENHKNPEDDDSRTINFDSSSSDVPVDLDSSIQKEDISNSEIDLRKMYEDIASKIPIDDKNLPSKNMFSFVSGNMFSENDNQSLAGKIIAKEIYDKLVNRLGYESKLTPQEVIQLGKKDFEDFKIYIEQLNKQERDKGNEFRFDVNRPSGVTGFHLNGEEGHVSRDHLFYFSKTANEWKDAQEQQVRAYITIDPEERENIQRHFVDLCKKLYDEGIDFSGKAASPNGLEKRTDNIVLYISLSDQAKASELIKDFLDDQGIGNGHVYAAIPSPKNGLSWALEPSEKDIKIWQEVSGSSEPGSYNAVVAAKIAPMFLRRISEAHQKLGNQNEADAFNSEAERIEKIIKG